MSAVAETLDPDGWVSRVTEAEFDAKLAARAARRAERGELTRLSAYMNKGGRLVRDDVPGVGVVYRAHRVCTVAPFSARAVEMWCAREGKPLPSTD